MTITGNQFIDEKISYYVFRYKLEKINNEFKARFRFYYLRRIDTNRICLADKSKGGKFMVTDRLGYNRYIKKIYMWRDFRKELLHRTRPMWDRRC